MEGKADYKDYEVSLLDQLTAYQLAEPDIEQVDLCALVKAKAPRIEWHSTQRTPEQVMEYLKKAELVAGQIEQGKFYKQPSKWYRQCEFLPVCTGNEREARETLVKLA
ncbi:MAG: hypothetical protein DMG32_25055 [Acidobacteria bacterium]|nr:MAG: hypothetical protein DMG32_25055 [Acidobacteriota bacterium]